MIITREWVKEYFKTQGTKFIIPKEVTKIEEDAFSDVFGDYGSENLAGDIEIEVIFEKDSQLEEIGAGAFRGCTITNKVTLPKNIKRIGDFAFFSCGDYICLQEGTELDKKRYVYMCWI